MVGLEKYSRPTLRDQDQDQDRKYQDQDQDQDLRSQDQDQDQDREKSVSSALETKTAVSRTTSLVLQIPTTCLTRKLMTTADDWI